MPGYMLQFTIPPSLFNELNAEAEKRSTSIQNIARERLGAPSVQRGRPAASNTGVLARSKVLIAEYQELEAKIAFLRSKGAPVPAFLTQTRDDRKRTLSNLGEVDIRTGKLFSEDPATPAFPPERADSDAKKAPRRKK